MPPETGAVLVTLDVLPDVPEELPIPEELPMPEEPETPDCPEGPEAPDGPPPDPPPCPEEPESLEDDADAGGWKGTALRMSSAMRCNKVRASWASSTRSWLFAATFA